MRSTSGQHFIALDHLRALAAFMVVSWHFLHYSNGTPVPFEGAPLVFPLALMDEGHTGVSLFMVLSGYLFAKLLNGKRVKYLPFFWNRFVRLAPLLSLVFVVVGVKFALSGGMLKPYVVELFRGFIFPVWPNGGWSVATELHFYFLLPVLLGMSRRSIPLPLLIVALAIAFRAFIFWRNGEVQSLAYWTIVGRIDQFVLGIVAWSLSSWFNERRRLLLAAWFFFMIFWWWFDRTGGFYLRPSYPSGSLIWVWLPTIEALGYAALILWYEGLGVTNASFLSKLIARIGECSYSIYLLHVFLSSMLQNSWILKL
jgi:peptidoglycan/LPS O-acetylase OafA/YrhL